MIDNTLEPEDVASKDEWMIWLDDVLVLGSPLMTLEKNDDVLWMGQDPLTGDGHSVALAVIVGFSTNSLTQTGNASSFTDTFAGTPLRSKMFRVSLSCQKMADGGVFTVL